MNLRVYKSLKPGKQREAYLARFKRRRGIPVANQKKKKEEKQEEEPMPSPQRMVPGNFVWPEGLDREEFLAKKPGAERMARKIATFLGDEGLENDLDDGVDDGPGTEILPPRTENVIPRTMITRFLDPYFKPASYHPLFRSDGCSLLESIEPRGGHVNRRKFGAVRTLAQSRGVLKTGYTDVKCFGGTACNKRRGQSRTRKYADLVDYLVYMASVKSLNIGELIGSFDDSAAVAGSIVIEEYMTQLMEDAVEQKKALCPVTEASVQSFTRELLSGFNWRLFEQQNCSSLSDSLTDQAALADKVAELISPEFVSTQPLQLDVGAHKADLLRWIRSAVAIPSLASTGEGPHITTNMQTNEKASNLGDDRQDNEVEKAQRTHRIRLSVKANPMHGHPAYKLHFTTALKDGHHVETSVGGLDSKEKAKATIMQLSKAVERQEERSKRAQEGHQQQQVPAPTRVDPIAPPVLHPPPPTDPNDPDTPMFLHVWEHFNAYAKQKWEASVAASSNALTSEDEASATEQSTKPYQGRPKRRKVSFQ
ncbi:unnamed protein product [Phytophthora lilii]|uniref:Unnamed protein product n=1 Tax=Phytophthora lilii TaxID=2077276 RepID=A0A9W6TFF9_9STRA|nr:unnamed protein product [Phytophthora lilii]